MKRSLALCLALLLAACSSQSPGPTPSTGATQPGPTDSAAASEVAEATPSDAPTLVPTAPPTSPPTTPPTARPTQRPTGTPNPTGTPKPTVSPGPTFAQLIGQKLMVAMSGTSADASLLGRIRRGEVGGVILFGSNIVSASQLTALTKQLQAAATAGHQPPLLISTDQEGGSVKRVSWIGPSMSAPQMGANGSVANARSQGTSTGRGLLGLGINDDLAPVADVPASTSSFMYQQGRTWSFSATTTESLSDAFAEGLDAAGVVPTLKHFPGLGYALQNTDTHVDTITASAAQLDPGLDPYRGAIANGLPMIMLSNAWYTAWDPNNAAGWSNAIGTTLLRGELGFKGVTITDSLNGIGSAMGVSPQTLSVRASKAGTDMILLTGSEASSETAYQDLLADAQIGKISRATLLASYERILALKAGL